jgi:hypothetical protein
MTQKIYVFTNDEPRIQYVFEKILGPRFGIEFHLTNDIVVFEAAENPKLVYTTKNAIQKEADILQHPFILQGGKINIQNKPAIFQGIPSWTMNDLAGVPDPVAEIFLHLSRYEEYLDFETDVHGRFQGIKSILSQSGYLLIPVVDQWINLLGNWFFSEGKLKTPIKLSAPQVHATYDIDMPWKYLHRNAWKNFLSKVKHLFSGELKAYKNISAVLSQKSKDSYDTYQYLLEKSKPLALKPHVFFQVGGNSAFDRIGDYDQASLEQLIMQLVKYWQPGLHPGYTTVEHTGEDMLAEEKNLLEKLSGTEILNSRQHFVRLRMPQTYELLIKTGIKNDFSCGFADVSGFRAATAYAFPWYNLNKETATDLTLHPFIFMDVTMRQYEKLTVESAKAKIDTVWRELNITGGRLCFVWHNSSFCEDDGWADWKIVFEHFLQLEKYENSIDKTR